MKTNRILILMLTVLTIIGCEPVENKLEYNGDLLAAFSSPVANELFLYDGTPGVKNPVSASIGLIGISNSDVTVDISIDESSTAIEGVHYELLNSAISIPAGSFGSTLPINVLLDGFNGDPEDVRTIVVNISNASGADVAINLQKLSLAIAITCPSEIPEGTYTETGTGVGSDVTLTKTGDDTYMISQMNFDYYSPTYDDVPGYFTDVCNSLTLNGVPTDVFGIAWIGNGRYDPVTGNLSFTVYDAT